MGRTIEAFTLRIGGDMEEVLKGIDRVGERAQRLGKNLQRTGRTLTRNFTAPIAAAGAAALAAAVRIGGAADELLDLEQQTGLSTDALQEFRRVATVAGVEQDVLGKAAQQLTMRLARGAEGSADLNRALEALGLSARDAEGNLRPMDEIVGQAISRLSSMEDQTQRNVLATQIFAGAASDLAPVLGLGAEEIERLRGEAHDLGLVLDREALEAANQFRVGWQTLRESLSASVNQIGIAVIPVMNKLTDALQDNLVPWVQKAVQWVQELDEDMVIMAASVAGVVAAIGPLVLGGGKLISMFALVLSPAGLVIAALASLAFTATVVARNWDVLRLQGTLIWAAIRQTVFGAIDGILGALERLPLVGERMFGGLREQFDRFATESLAKSAEKIRELEMEISAAGASMSELATGTDVAGAALEGFNAAVPGAGEAAERTREPLDDLDEWARNFEPRLAGVTDGLLGLAGGLRDVGATAIDMDEVTDEADRSLTQLESFGVRTAQRMGDAFGDFATGSAAAFNRFVESALQDLARLLFRMAVVRALTAAVPGAGSLFAAGGLIPGRQRGGPVQPGRPFLVGEAGPELFVPAQAGQVVSNDQLSAAGAGAVSLTVNVPAARDLVTMVRDNQWREAIEESIKDYRERGGRF